MEIKDKKIGDQIKAIKAHAKNITGNVDERIKSLESENEQLHRRISKKNETLEKERETHNKELEDIQIDSILRRKFSEIPLQKPYQEPLVKEGIFTAVSGAIRSQATLKLNEQKTDVNVFRADDPALKLHDEKTSKELGLNDLIGPLVQTYVQATPPAGPGGSNGRTEYVAPSGPPAQAKPDAASTMLDARKELMKNWE